MKLKNPSYDADLEQSSDCLIIYDLEKMRKRVQESFVNKSLGYGERIVTLSIGKPMIEASFDHNI